MIQLYIKLHVTSFYLIHYCNNSINNFELSKTPIHKKKENHMHLFLEQSTDANLPKT